MPPPSSQEQIGVDARLQAISSLTGVELEHLDVEDLLVEMLVRITKLIDADTAAVLQLEPGSHQLVARAAYGIEEEVHQGVRVPVGRGFAGRIAAERRPVILDHVDATTVENPLLYERGIQSMLGVPLLSGSQLIGVLHVGTLSNRTFTANDIELLELVAARVTAAVQARELEIERSASRLLQRSLLPSALPDLPEISFAARYVPAEQGIGGDWYDAFLLPSGNLWVMVGDVAGHGLRAAAIMGRLRASLRSYAIENDAPELVLAKADRKLQYFEPGQTATVLCGVLQPPYNSILLATTGHLPPVLATPGKGSALINMPVSPPLGVVNQIEPQCIELKLPVGSSLAACTDGLVERRGESLEVGLNRLVAATRAVEPEIMCREIMEKLIGRSVPRDDVALLAMRRNPSG